MEKSILNSLRDGSLKMHSISNILKEEYSLNDEDAERRAVEIRRELLNIPNELSLDGFPYHIASGACCENMIGYIGIPVGIAGPLKIDGIDYMIPLATTEGALVASTNRGCKAIGEITTRITSNGMSRGPFIKLSSLKRAFEVKEWIDSSFEIIKQTFESTSNHIRLISIKSALCGRFLFLRFKADTGEAMGMNMCSRATEATLNYMINEICPDSLMSCLSGNFCTDKKAGAAINWTEGRGYSVIAEALVSIDSLKQVLKVESAKSLAELAQAKNFIGSSMAGVAAGGQNAHAANLVAAIFLVCGQDPAQVVESSACISHFEAITDGSLLVSVTMPCVEVGVLGGGTRLPAQSSMVRMLTENIEDGKRAETLARIITGTVLAGELSLISSLHQGTLVSTHLSLNRK